MALWIVGYLIVGVVLTIALYKGMKIDWGAEAADTKALIIVTPVGWPLVLLLIAGIWVVARVFKK